MAEKWKFQRAKNGKKGNKRSVVPDDQRCTATKNDGNRCSLRRVKGSDFCSIHDPHKGAEIKEKSAIGKRERSEKLDHLASYFAHWPFEWNYNGLAKMATCEYLKLCEEPPIDMSTAEIQRAKKDWAKVIRENWDSHNKLRGIAGEINIIIGGLGDRPEDPDDLDISQVN